MKLYTYQKKALEKLREQFKTHDKVVLAICPGGGKTFTSLQFAKEFKGKTLVLAHGTSQLRTQWNENLDQLGTEQFGNLTIDLPQSLYRKELDPVDLLIVDEAHEFYLANKSYKGKKTAAGMVQQIEKKVKPKKTLLLTGTPSKFIKRGYPVVLVSAQEILDSGYESVLSNVYFGLATTHETIRKENFNKKGDVKTNFEFKKVQEDLDDLLDSMISRLKGVVGKTHPMYKKLTANWPSVFNSLDKTMFACANVNQADQVYEYFKNRGVNCVVSHYYNDTDSAYIEEFKNDSNIKVLIVVNRGTLGFNMPELVNVVDMSSTKNIDSIYQLYARAMRYHPDYKYKFFFKLTPESESELNKFYMTAALHMLGREFLSSYNGHNLGGMKLAVKPVEKSKKKGESKKKPATKNTPPYQPVDEFFYSEISSSKLMNDIWNKQGAGFNEYAYVTLKEIKIKNYGYKFPIEKITEENLRYMIETGEVDERIYL